jgi:hypothetical protein
MGADAFFVLSLSRARSDKRARRKKSAKKSESADHAFSSPHSGNPVSEPKAAWQGESKGLQ